jgi:hypothetical protein
VDEAGDSDYRMEMKAWRDFGFAAPHDLPVL